MTSREKFEAWYLENWGHTEGDHEARFERGPDSDENYYRLGVRLAHEAWQAASKASERQVVELAVQLASAESKLMELASESAEVKVAAILLADEAAQIYKRWNLTQQPDGDIVDMQTIQEMLCACHETPAADAFLDDVRAQARKEGAHFVANRMLAAWEAGFIDDTAKNAADIARMILTSTEFMADAPEGDFDRYFADGVLEDIAAQLRKGGAL